MKKILMGSAALCLLAASVQAADAPTAATIVTAEDLQKVLELGGPNATDHTVSVVDIGDDFQMDVALIRRAATQATASPEALAARAAARAKMAPCGAETAPAGAKLSPPGNYLQHDEIGEVYLITKGEGTMLTGGTLYGGTRNVAENTGPGCSGKVYGDFQVQKVKAGDLIVVPVGVPHGFSDIPGGMEYINFRPDPKHFLPVGFVYPGLKK